MRTLPTIVHPTGRPNYTEVTLRGASAEITLVYSYTTCVGFQCYGVPDLRGPFVRQNEWGPTTGKHLWYFAPSVEQHERMSAEAFATLLDRAMRLVFGGEG